MDKTNFDQRSAMITMELVRDDFLGRFRLACLYGYLETAKSLQGVFRFGNDEVDNFALDAACAGGHMEVVEWVHDTFYPNTLRGRRDIVISALVNACEQGHLEIVKWLHRKYHLSVMDIRDRDPEAPVIVDDGKAAVRYACCKGRIDIMQWLHETLHLEDEDVRKVATMACMSKQPEMMEWLRTNFSGIPPE